MTDKVIVEYRGFQANLLARVYTFQVREAGEEREFTLNIANEAFLSHRVRYQDAPDVCSLKLRRELATHANQPPRSHFDITDLDLDDYRSTHAPRKGRNSFDRKAMEDF